MEEFWKTVIVGITAFLFGAGGLAIINVIQKRWEMRFDRKAQKEDKAEEKEDKLDEISKMLTEFIEKQTDVDKKMEERLRDNEENMEAQSEALKLILLDRVLHLGQKYIVEGEVSFDDRKRLGDMHDVYHNGLHGNGDADKVIEGVYELPLKQ